MFEYIYPQQLYCIHFIKSGKHISHSHNRKVINDAQALSRELDCTLRAFFKIVPSESCCSRQRASLEIEIYSRVCFIAAYISVSKAEISLFFYKYQPKAILHSR